MMAFTTRKSLLVKVRDQDEVSWHEFYATYKPLILLCGRDRGLSADENDELVQQVMAEIFRKDILANYNPDQVPDNIVFQYDPARGRFRHFLKKIIRNHAIRIYHKRRNDLPLDEMVDVPMDRDWDRAWEDEWQQHVLTMALEELKGRIQPETFVAFEMYALQNRPVREVTEFLGLSVSSVYTAKNRCIAKLKEIIEDLEEK